MNKNDLKKVLKPLIRECIREVIFEEKGALSHIISEVASGLATAPQKATIKESPEEKWMSRAKSISSNKQTLIERKKKLLDSIGNKAYNGVDLFEGTTATAAPSGGAQGPLSNVAPSDPGVDISNIFSGKSAAIFSKMMEKK